MTTKSAFSLPISRFLNLGIQYYWSNTFLFFTWFDCKIRCCSRRNRNWRSRGKENSRIVYKYYTSGQTKQLFSKTLLKNSKQKKLWLFWNSRINSVDVQIAYLSIFGFKIKLKFEFDVALVLKKKCNLNVIKFKINRSIFIRNAGTLLKVFFCS